MTSKAEEIVNKYADDAGCVTESHEKYFLDALREYGAEVRKRDVDTAKVAGDEYSRNAGNTYARHSGRAAASRIAAAIEREELP
jgi:hypothetical protein